MGIDGLKNQIEKQERLDHYASIALGALVSESLYHPQTVARVVWEIAEEMEKARELRRRK